MPHHLIDVVEPGESYSLGRYVEDACAAIHDIQRRGRPAIAVGGTMLYVQGLTRGVFEGPPADLAFRERLRERARCEGVALLHAQLVAIDPAAASRIHPNDLRRIERALEVHHVTGSRISDLQTQWEQGKAPFEWRIAALRRSKDEANARINARVKRMMEQGLLEEIRSLLAEPGSIGPQASQAVGYAELIAHLKGELSLEEAVEQIKINTRRLAKHQRTWMRRMRSAIPIDITEFDTPQGVADRVQAAWMEG